MIHLALENESSSFQDGDFEGLLLILAILSCFALWNFAVLSAITVDPLVSQ